MPAFKACEALVGGYPGLADELAQPEDGQRFATTSPAARASLIRCESPPTCWPMPEFRRSGRPSASLWKKLPSEVRYYAQELGDWAKDKSSKFHGPSAHRAL